MLRTCTFFLLLINATIAAAADSRLGAGCDLQEIDVHDKTEFLRFDHDLRYALERGDAAMLALLVQFPLQVNYSDKSHISLDDAATLQKQFDRTFPRKLRDAVKTQSLDDMFCKYANGVAYDNGNIWVNLAGAAHKQFRIVAVNVPGDDSGERKSGDIDLACSTQQFRIVIDNLSDAKARYRVWNLPHGVHEKPDLELPGTRDIVGTSPCTHRIWRFENNNATYLISEPGCGQDTPPAGALAELQVLIKDAPRAHAWCF